VFKGSFGPAMDDSATPHTLILGTQPSDVSLGAGRYYDFHTNALWHIVGDALGFRRGWLDGNGRGPPKSVTASLLHDRTIDRYEDALALLTSKGYALWDVVKESERRGSLDGDIKNAVAADVRGLVRAHPSITRICLASGKSTADFFKKYHKSWLAEPGAFCVHPNKFSQETFAKLVPSGGGGGGDSGGGGASSAPIELVVMESVSSARVPPVSFKADYAAKRLAAYAEAGYPHLAARASAYAWKRQQWFDDCFDRVLSEAERAKKFGERAGDLISEEGDV